MLCAQLLDEQVSLQRYWNYLRRQLYVMDTYVTPHNRLVNHTMLALHTYLSWAFVLPCLTGASAKLLYKHSRSPSSHNPRHICQLSSARPGDLPSNRALFRHNPHLDARYFQ